MSEQDKLIIDHDGQWGLIIQQLPVDFIKFFLKDLAELIDFDYPPEFMSNKLYELFPEGDPNRPKESDQLIKVRLKNGEDHYCFIHVEVQSYFDKNFPKRMFIYFSRIFEKCSENITAIAIFTGATINKDYKVYQYEYQGTKLSYTYNAYVVRDKDEKALLENKNPFALVVLTCLYLLKDKKLLKKPLINEQREEFAEFSKMATLLKWKIEQEKNYIFRFVFKKKLLEVAIKNGTFSSKVIVGLLRFVDCMLRLPAPINYVLLDTIKEIKIDKNMVITDDNRIYVKAFLKYFSTISIEELEKTLKQAAEDKKTIEREREARLKEREARLKIEAKEKKEREAKLKEREARLKIEAEQKKEREARIKERKARLKIEAKQKKEREARLKAEQNNIINIYNTKVFTIEKIAKILNLKVAYIKKVLDDNNISY